MASRNLLHKSKLGLFRAFLDHNHINWREGRGEWQVMQIQMEDKTWQAIFEKLNSPEHYSVPEPLVKLVKIFIKGNR